MRLRTRLGCIAAIISATAPFLPSDLAGLRRDAPLVARRFLAHGASFASGPGSGAPGPGTAGASAPEVLVKDVVEYLQSVGYGSVDEVEVMPENVRFGLPPEIVQAIASAPPAAQ